MKSTDEYLRTLFSAALNCASDAERAAYLDRACAGDAALRAEVDALVRAHREARGFLGAADPDDTAAHSPAEAPGTRTGPYKIVGLIGEGGMGAVYLAQQTEPVRRLVALKVIKEGMDSRQVLARFEAERQALALMDHPNIAKVLDAGTTGRPDWHPGRPGRAEQPSRMTGRPYFVMELVKGVPITTFCDERRLTPRQRLELMIPVCQAVQHAHTKGIIHRDVKPTNVLVALYDGEPVPKVIDFGVAKAAGQPLTDKTLVTGLGSVVGTPEYMSPEQAELNQLDIDTRSDVYSLGVLLYELLTGTTPLTRERTKDAALLEVLRVIREEEPPKPSTRLSSTEELPSIAARRGTEPARLPRLVRGELDWVVMKALEKDRDRRYATANGLAKDLERYLADEPVEAGPPSVRYRLRKLARRNLRALVSAAAVGLALLVAVGTLGWALRDRDARAREAAMETAAREAGLAAHLLSAVERAEWLQEQGKRAEALAAFEGAEARAGVSTPEPAVRQRVTRLRERLEAEGRDLAFQSRFDDIRLREQSRVDVVESHFLRAAAYPELRQAFHEYGIPLGVTPPPEAVGHIRSRPPQVQAQLVAALHECLIHVPRQEATRQWLAAVLDAADDDPWRIRVRRAWGGKNAAALRGLVIEADITGQPPSFLVWVADVLEPDPAALDFYRRVVTAYPGDFWANHNCGAALHRAGRSREALRYYTAALALRPNNPGVCVNRASALRAAQELDAAVLDLRRAVALAPKYAVAHSNLGLALQAKGDLEGANAAFAKALALSPKARSAGALSGLAANLLKQGDVPGALDLLRAALAADPTHANTRLYLSEALGRLGKWKEAIALAEEYVGLKPRDAWGYNHLAWMLVSCPEAELRDGARAVELARKRHELAQPDGFSWNTLGVAHYRAGNWNEAIAALEQSMRLFNGRREAMNTFVLAMCHWQTGNRAVARRWYDKAVAWMDVNEHSEEPLSVYLRRFRAEAEELLGINGKKDR